MENTEQTLHSNGIKFENINLPLADMQQLYQDAEGDEITLMKLIWQEVKRREGKLEEELAQMLDENDLVIDVRDMQGSKNKQVFMGEYKPLTFGSYVAIQKLDLDMHKGPKEKKSTQYNEAEESLAIAYVCQGNPEEIAYVINDKDALMKRAFVWGYSVEMEWLKGLMDHFEKEMEKFVPKKKEPVKPSRRKTKNG